MAYSLLALLDDVAAVMDDVGLMTKIAIKKTSGVMSDDLAVNANQVDGVEPSRELPIVWSIFKGSLLNKVIALTLILSIDYFYSPLNTVILICGGLFLSYEGMHKVVDYFLKKKSEDSQKEFSEKQRIKGAIRTDFVLSVEIIVLAKSFISGERLETFLTLCIVALLASVIIYGLVAIIVKIDDFGSYLALKGYKKIGLSLLNSMPIFMKCLSVVGTIAMFLVAGGIFTHSFHIKLLPLEAAQNLIFGIISGLITYFLVSIFNKFRTI
jgi:predicted DNA repair protein MutK